MAIRYTSTAQGTLVLVHVCTSTEVQKVQVLFVLVQVVVEKLTTSEQHQVFY
jgi:hypothetical protein